MSDLQSRPFEPNPKMCCDACVFGGREHARFCALHHHEKPAHALKLDPFGHCVYSAWLEARTSKD